METLIYKKPFNQIKEQDNPQSFGDETICVCLIDGIDGEFETYELIKTGGKTPIKVGLAYGLENSEKMAYGFHFQTI